MLDHSSVHEMASRSSQICSQNLKELDYRVTTAKELKGQAKQFFSNPFPSRVKGLCKKRRGGQNNYDLAGGIATWAKCTWSEGSFFVNFIPKKNREQRKRYFSKASSAH